MVKMFLALIFGQFTYVFIYCLESNINKPYLLLGLFEWRVDNVLYVGMSCLLSPLEQLSAAGCC